MFPSWSAHLQQAYQDFTKSRQQMLLVLLTIAVLLGVCFRLVNLDRKLYWHDETFTSMRISGYHEAEVVQAIRAAGIVDMGYMQTFQTPHPERRVGDTVKALTIDGPQHPPLYYGMAHFWVKLFGGSVTSVRLFPVLLSLFALPAVYWLGWELFQSHVASAIATIFLAVSPMHVLYAQESRQYSLWTVLIVVTGALVLRALRSPVRNHWLLYSLSQAALLYTTVLSAFVVVSHGVFVLLHQGLRVTQRVWQFLLATLLSLLLYAPWIWVFLHNRRQVKDTLNVGSAKWAFSAADIVKGLMRLPGRLFFDFNVNPGDPWFYSLLQWFFTPAILLLTLYAFYYLMRTTSLQVWAFPLTLVGGYGGLMVLQDLLVKGQGGGGSTTYRYMIPCWIGIQLAISYLLAQKLTPAITRPTAFWKGVLAVLVTTSLLSSLAVSQAQLWWSKGSISLEAIYPTAEYINQAEKPILISDAVSWDLLMMSYLINPDVKVLAKPICYVCQLPPEPDFRPNLVKLATEYTDLFIFPESTPAFTAWLETQPFRLETIPMGDRVSPNIVLKKLVPIRPAISGM